MLTRIVDTQSILRAVKAFILVSLAPCLIFLSTPTSANLWKDWDGKFYADGNLGWSHVDVPENPSTALSLADDNSTAYLVGGGVRIVPFKLTENQRIGLGVEGGYFDSFDDVEYNRNGGCNGEGDVNYDVSSTYVAGKLIYFIDAIKVSIFGKGGAAFTRSEMKVNFNDALNETDNSTNGLVGAGVAFNVTEWFQLQGQWVRIIEAEMPSLEKDANIDFIGGGFSLLLG